MTRLPDHRHALAAAALALLTAAGLTACSSSGAQFTPPTSAAPHSTARTSAVADQSSAAPSVPASTPASSADGVDATRNDPALAPRLLGVAEIGGGFDRTESDTTDSPLPCTPQQPGPLTQVPSTSHAQIDFASPKQDATITERVLVYDDDAAAQRVVGVARTGFGCPQATSSGASIGIVGPQDIRSSIMARVNSADDWQLRAANFQAEMIVVRVGSTVIQLQFATMTTTIPGNVDPSRVLQTAIAKAINGS